jgi:hypothetical protein
VKYYVYYNWTMCHTGNNLSGLDEYETYAEAVARIEYLKQLSPDDVIAVLIKGVNITPKPKEGE